MIYLASPHNDPSYQVKYLRYIQVVEYTAWLLDLGLLVVSPIAHSKIIAGFRLDDASSFAGWRDLDLHWITICSSFGVLMLDGWKSSDGVRQELAHAEKCHKPIFKFKWEWLRDPEIDVLSILSKAGATK